MTMHDHVQLSLVLAVFAVGMWYLFDRTLHGFVISAVVAVAGSVAVQLLVSAGAYAFMRPDFVGIQSWVPCVLFSATVCFGTIGRSLHGWAVEASRRPAASALASPLAAAGRGPRGT